MEQVESWPVARSYTGPDRNRISLPLGGIGTGTVGFGGRGQFRDWELENHPSKGLTFPLTFLACRVSGAGARVLEGALLDGLSCPAGRTPPVRLVLVRGDVPVRPRGRVGPVVPRAGERHGDEPADP